jgi:hypothetical protein
MVAPAGRDMTEIVSLDEPDDGDEGRTLLGILDRDP